MLMLFHLLEFGVLTIGNSVCSLQYFKVCFVMF